jgi:hypothetical protein
MEAVISLLAVLLLAACATPAPPPPPPPAEPPGPACDLTAETLPGRTFVLQMRQEGGKFAEDNSARAQFYDATSADGQKQLKVKYNAKALTAMYDYTCVAGPKEITCWQDNPDPADYCRALAANKGPEACTVEEVAKVTGLKPEVAQKGVDAVVPNLKKMNDNDWKVFKAAYDNPNTQLRGKLHIKINTSECRLTITDRYETMTAGTLREMENIVGAARFVETKQEMMFENCTDAQNLVATNDPKAWPKAGESMREGPASSAITFRYVGKEDAKPKSGCTYTMDVWSGGLPITKGKQVATDDKGRLDWSFTRMFPDKGIQVVHMVRHRTCGSEPPTNALSCQGIRVQ